MKKFISVLALTGVILVTSNNSILKKDGDKWVVVKEGISYQEPVAQPTLKKSFASSGKMIERSYARSSMKTFTLPRPTDREVDL